MPFKKKKKEIEGKLQTILHSKVTSKQDLSANVELQKGYTYSSEGFPLFSIYTENLLEIDSNLQKSD